MQHCGTTHHGGVELGLHAFCRRLDRGYRWGPYTRETLKQGFGFSEAECHGATTGGFLPAASPAPIPKAVMAYIVMASPIPKAGGQRRRVTTGEMLCSGAAAVFGDEISTGLDSATTIEICRALTTASRCLRTVTVLSLLQVVLA